jgi:septal ring factor EnvC (AmiA/AmiB activator)
LPAAAIPVGAAIAGGVASAAAGKALDKVVGKRDDDDEEELEESEEIEESLKISEDDLVGLIEEFVFSSSSPSPNGYASAPTSEIEEDQEIQRVRKEMEEKEAENKDLKEKLDQLTNQGNKFKRIILELKDKLDEVSLDNARYLYSNRVLKSASLNERQKEKLVESISSAKTIEEAKVIFDTLQSTVQSISKDRKPKSLDEVVQKRSSRLYHIKEQKQSTSDSVVERMQRLAGIQK